MADFALIDKTTDNQGKTGTNEDLVESDSSLKNCFSFGNSQKVYKDLTDEDTIPKSNEELGEMRSMLLSVNTQLVSDHDLKSKSQEFTEQFLRIVGNKCRGGNLPGVHYARTLIQLFEAICLERRGHKDYLEVIEDESVVVTVLSQLQGNTASLQKRRWYLKFLYKTYFETSEYSALHPIRNNIFTILNTYGQKPRAAHHKAIVHERVAEFLDYLTEKNLHWHKRARVHCMVLLKWTVANRHVSTEDVLKVNVRELDARLLGKFRQHLQELVSAGKMTVPTAYSYIATFRKWFEFLMLKGYVLRNPCLSVENFKMVYPVKDDLPNLEQVKPFLTAILERKEDSLKWYSLFVTVMCLGIRANEALQVNQSDVYLDSGQIYIHRKGGDHQLLPIPGVVSLVLELHLKSLPLAWRSPDSPLWRGLTGSRLSYDALRKYFHIFADAAGLKSKGACHLFRRLLFTELCYQTGDLDRIAKLAGHKLVVHLNPYVRSNKESVKKNFKQKMPTVGGELCADNLK